VTADTSEIVERARRFFRTRRPEGVASAYVFGSRGRGESHPESDLDVGVVFDRELLPDADDRSRASIDLSSELIGAVHLNDVQVVSLIDAPPELAATALREGRRIYRTYAETDRQEARRILLLDADLQPFLRRTRRRKLEVLGR
jgi:predicted nucleotidyltransferase